MMKEKAKDKRIFTIPNVLTFVRILLIPLLLWLYIGKGHYYWAAGVMLLSGATDIVDGWIARHFDMITTLGKALDPFADKATQLAILICLISRWPHVICLLIVQLIKELFVLITSWWAAHVQKFVKGAEWYGKLATVVVFFTIFIHVVWLSIPIWLSDMLLIISAAVAVFTMTLYGVRNFRYIHEAKAAKNK